ncbi:universal stress protein [Pseudooceanicola sediminis]|uniref:Universal stress protein n=1 Tax=Pseudooceanicola sediminis TaxID=2211117 RepID=A0A399IX10_9RHOB|nr:universal stress protein [Pseudooceanicola sediminis]KAA2312917.1 universal stress protein [Puniceibacterium sp. HSS470]RII37683.1 universal stress protein [Pseudooceanicola sediminis]|tara:strand:- start:32398 stop:33234 length:837 start_codon:yes stop_codon:yes gene_type:complete
MAYKSIFTVVTQNDDARIVLDNAVTVAIRQDAHLDVLCLGIDRSQVGYYYPGENALILQEAIDTAVAESRDLEKTVTQAMAGAELRWSSEADVTQLGDIGRHVGWRARFADLVVLPKPYGPNRQSEHEQITEACLFEGRAPILILPAQATPEALKTPLIAWNETPEALAAVRAALPLLQQARDVHIVVIDPPVHGPNRSDPGGLLATWLARHGVSASIEVVAKTMPRVSDQISRHAQDISADLIVMGGYGHSRFRQAILGGATRNMLEASELPIFLAH